MRDRRIKAFDGVYAETSFEISPYLPSVMGASDFYRLNFSGKLLKTLYDAEPAARRNVFTVYLGDFFSIDYADAKTRMPLYVMQTFGGTVPRYGLAESVLGFERFSWDNRLKIVNNLELRFNLPAVFFKDLVPGLLAYFDIGYGAGYWGDASGTKGGFLASAGLGAYVDLFDIVYLRVYTHFPVIGEKLDGDSLDLDLDFNLHF